MKFGTVKHYDSRTGEGWIAPEDGGRDIAVGTNAVANARLGQLAKGQTIGFHIAPDQRAAIDLWATWSNR